MIRYDVQIVGINNEETKNIQVTGISVDYISDIVEQLEVEGFINYTMVVNRVE